MANNIQVNKIDTSGQECWDVLYNVDTVGTKTGILKTAGTLLDRNIKLNISTSSISVPKDIPFTVTNAGRVDITQSSSTAGTVTIKAYNNAATPALTSAQTVVTGGKWKYTTVTAGTSQQGPYYGAVYVNPISNTSATGDYNTSISVTKNSTITPFVAINEISTYGFTSDQPTGTNGTNYLTINPGASATTWSATPKATIATAGYLATGNKTGTTITKTPVIEEGINYYIPIVEITVDGGSLTGTDFSITPTVTFKSGSSTNMSNITIGDRKNDYPYYFKVNAESSEENGNTRVDRAVITYSNKAGAVQQNTYTTGIESDFVSPAVTIGKGTGNTYISLKGAAITVTGEGAATAPAINRINTKANGAINVGGISTTLPTNKYFVSVQGIAPATTLIMTKTVNTAGYIKENTQITASGSTTETTGDIYYVPIPTGVAEGNTGSVTKVTASGSANTNIGSILGNPQSSEPSGYYVAFKGSGSSRVKNAGWFATGELSAGESSTQYFPITTGSITPLYTNSGLTTYFKSGTSSNYSISITPQYTNTAGYIPAHSSAVNGSTTAYWKIKSGEASGMNGTVTRRIAAITEGSTGINISSNLGTVSDTAPNSYFLAFAGSGQATISTAGWFDQDTTIQGGSNIKYFAIPGVKLLKPSSGSKTFKVIVPNGASNYIDFLFTISYDGTVTIDSTGLDLDGEPL